MAGPLLPLIVGKGLEAVGLPSGLSNPVSYFAGQIGNAIGNKLGIPGEVLSNTKGYVKDKLIEGARNAPSVPGGGEVGGRGEGSSVDQGFNLRRPGYDQDEGFKRGGKVKVSSVSKRADGIAQRGKTKGRYL